MTPGAVRSFEMDPPANDRSLTQLSRVCDALESRKARAKLLEEIAWPRDVEEAFFAAGAQRLPEVRYAIDREAMARQTAELDRIEKSIEGDDPIASWLRRH